MAQRNSPLPRTTRGCATSFSFHHVRPAFRLMATNFVQRARQHRHHAFVRVTGVSVFLRAGTAWFAHRSLYLRGRLVSWRTLPLAATAQACWWKSPTYIPFLGAISFSRPPAVCAERFMAEQRETREGAGRQQRQTMAAGCSKGSGGAGLTSSLSVVSRAGGILFGCVEGGLCRRGEYLRIALVLCLVVSASRNGS